MPHIRRFYPPVFGAYLEPFVGSGAVFFDLYNQGLFHNRRVVLLDTNADLVGCYRAIRDDTRGVIDALTALAAGHQKDPHKHFYDVRDQRFNPARHASQNNEGPDETRYSASLAAMMIYLNRTGFNGLFRLNSQGRFNVPIGRYQNPRICDADNLEAVATALRDDVTVDKAPLNLCSIVRSPEISSISTLHMPHSARPRSSRRTPRVGSRLRAKNTCNRW